MLKFETFKPVGKMVRSSTFALAIFCGALVAGLPFTSSAEAKCSNVGVTKPGEVYFLRGLANIFSLGLDAFAKEVTELGVENCVFNHSHWQAVVNDIVERSYQNQISEPIIIIGHSLGANIAPKMATAIGRHNIPVYYVAMLDPVEPTRVGENVKEITNYYIPKSKDTLLRPTSAFTGELQNENLRYWRDGFDHFNIDEKRSLRSVMKKRIVELTSSSSDAVAAASN